MKNLACTLSFVSFSKKLACVLSLVLISASCKKSNSAQKAAESDDWFRNGVDRFYFAMAPQEMSQEGSQAKVGQNMLWGIGCKGEPKDPAALVDAPTKCDNSKRARIPLNERTMVHQFPMASGQDDFKDGKCRILLGDEDLLNQVNLFPADFKTGAGSQTWNAFVTSAGFCGVSLAFMHPYVKTAAGSAWNRAAGSAMKSAGTGFKKFSGSLPSFGRFFEGGKVPVAPLNAPRSSLENLSQAYIANGKTLPAAAQAMVKNGNYNAAAELTYMSMASAKAGSAAGVGFLGKLTNNPAMKVAGRALDWFPCASTAISLAYAVAGRQTDKNMKAFFDGIAKAESLADTELTKGPQKDRYLDLVQKGNVLEALNYKIPAFVRNYNKNTNEKFEQGWALFGQSPQKFFETVAFIQTSMDQFAQNEAQADPASGNAPAPAPAVAPSRAPANDASQAQ